MKQKNTFPLTSKYLRKSFVLQHDQSDCGVACLLSLIQYYKGVGFLEKLRELSGTTKQGTTLLGLYQAANQSGFVAEGNEADIEALIEHGKPVILHVVMEQRLNHYVVCYGFENNRFIIGDPAKGIIFYYKEDLDIIWQSKSCLTLTPNDEFRKKTEIKSHKKQWFLSLLKEDSRLLMFSILLGLGIAILGLSMAIFSQKLIDDILPSKDFSKLITGIILLVFLLLIQVLFSALRDYFLIHQAKAFNNRIIDRFILLYYIYPNRFFIPEK